MSVQAILESRKQQLHTVGEGATVLQATVTMNKHKIGALPVLGAGGKIIGMFTERDVLRRVVAAEQDPHTTRVRQVMTRKVVTVTPDDAIDHARAVMNRHKIRHLPVVNAAGRLVGMISIGDLNAWSLSNGQLQIQYMQEYIHGRV